MMIPFFEIVFLLEYMFTVKAELKLGPKESIFSIRKILPLQDPAKYFLNIHIAFFGIILFIDAPITLQAK